MPTSEHLRDSVRQMIANRDREWVYLRTFFYVATTSYRQAASALHLTDGTAARKRVERLNLILNVKLVVSDGTGSDLTAAGRDVLEMIEAEFGHPVLSDK